MVILLKLLASKSPELASADDVSGKLESSLDLAVSRQHEKVEKSDNNMFSDIEQMVKGKKFSRYISLFFLKIKFLFPWLNYSFLNSILKLFLLYIKLFAPISWTFIFIILQQ